MVQETKQEAAAQPHFLTRRQMLRGVAGTGLVLLLPMFTGRTDAAGAAWTTTGKAPQFALNQPQRVALAGGVVLYITRTGPNRLTAVSAKCTHRGCEVGWDGSGKQFVCPCHGAAFSASGRNLHGTRRSPGEALPPLAGVPARQKGAVVQVNLQAAPSAALVPGRAG